MTERSFVRILLTLRSVLPFAKTFQTIQKQALKWMTVMMIQTLYPSYVKSSLAVKLDIQPTRHFDFFQAL